MPDVRPLHAVVFRVGGVVCALPAGVVREILPAVRATRVPGVPAAVEGLVNVRGGLVTVVDGHVLLGQPRPAESEMAVLLLDRGGKVAGLTVGEVLDFLEVPGATSRDQPPAGVDARLVQGTGNWNGQRMLLLDIDALLSPYLGG